MKRPSKTLVYCREAYERAFKQNKKKPQQLEPNNATEFRRFQNACTQHHRSGGGSVRIESRKQFIKRTGKSDYQFSLCLKGD